MNKRQVLRGRRVPLPVFTHLQNKSTYPKKNSKSGRLVLTRQTGPCIPWCSKQTTGMCFLIQEYLNVRTVILWQIYIRGFIWKRKHWTHLHKWNLSSAFHPSTPFLGSRAQHAQNLGLTTECRLGLAKF